MCSKPNRKSQKLSPLLTLILLNTTTATFANSVDPDQMASEEAIRSGSTLFVMQFVNWMKKLYQVIWLVESEMGVAKLIYSAKVKLAENLSGISSPFEKHSLDQANEKRPYQI